MLNKTFRNTFRNTIISKLLNKCNEYWKILIWNS